MAANWTREEIDELVATKPVHEVLETVIKSAQTYPILESALTVAHTPNASGGADSELSKAIESAYRLVEAELAGVRNQIAASIAAQANVFPAGVTDQEGVSFAVPVKSEAVQKAASKAEAKTPGRKKTTKRAKKTKKARRTRRS